MERGRLSQARHQRFWTLEEAAERLGVDVNTLHRWERGKATPRAYNRERLCEVYGMAAQELGLEDDHVSRDMQDVPPLEDSLTQFQQQDLTLRLMRIIYQSARYSELQTLITQELENSMNEDIQELLTRRDALRRLALLPIEMFGLSAVSAVLRFPTEYILRQCAAGITACWHLLRGKELLFVSDTVTRYLPTLKAIAHTASTTAQRKAAAELLAQGYQLKAILARHVLISTDSIVCAQQAAMYAKEAQSPLLQALALRAQAAAYYYANCWEQALQVAEQARAVLETSRGTSIPPLARSHIFVGLATYQARNGQKQEALRSLGKAHATFFAQPSDEPAPIWIDHSKDNLVLYDGMTYLHMGMQKKALDSFTQIQLTPSNYEMNRVEALLGQVVAEVSRADGRDMEYCIDHWVQGIEGAKALQSEQRFTEAIQAYTALCVAWPAEPRIKELRTRMTHW